MGNRERPKPSAATDLLAGFLLEGLISRKDLARALGLSERTLIGWATKGEGPDIVKVGSRVYYWQDDCDALCASMGKVLLSSAPKPRLSESRATSMRLDAPEYLPRSFTRAEIAQALGLTERTLLAWAQDEMGPPAVKPLGLMDVKAPKKARYFPEDVRAWLMTRVLRKGSQRSLAQREIASSPSETVGDPPPIL